MAYTTIDNPTLFFNTILWTGNGASTRSITGVGFQPDWIWVKCRSTGHDHYSWDSVRTNKKGLEPSDTSAERTPTLGSIDSDGFSFASLDSFYNANSDTYVGWNWKAGNSSGSSNGNGSITSTVTADTTSGFSIVSYTGTGSNATVGHGLGVAPKMIIIKSRDATENWVVFHKGLNSSGAGTYIYLNTSAASGGSGSNTSIFNNTAPTSSVFSIGTDGVSNNSSDAYIAYCFAEIKGYSKFGSYTGNNNANGTFVYTGFRPALVMTKITGSADGWMMFDNARDPFNVAEKYMTANGSGGDSTRDSIDFVSNGFKLRVANGDCNNGDYVYWAFAEHPFVTSGTKAAGTAR